MSSKEIDINQLQYRKMTEFGMLDEWWGQWVSFAYGHLLEVAPNLSVLLDQINARQVLDGQSSSVFVAQVGDKDEIVDIPTFEILS